MNKINVKINTINGKAKSIIIAMLLVFSVNYLIAQPGNNQVRIQGVYTPSVEEAKKILTSPTLTDTVYQTPEFKYDIKEKKLETPFKVAPIKPAKLRGEPLNKLYNNYVALGMGNYLTPYFEFYHSKLRSRSTKYGVHLKHHSSAGKIDDYAFPGWSENLVEIYGSKFWKKSVIDLSIMYKRDVNHAYGFKPSELDTSITPPKDIDYVQRYNLAGGNIHWYRYRLRKSEMNYDINANYYYLQDFFRSAENNANLDATFDWNINFSKALKNQRLGIKVKDKFYNNRMDTLAVLNSNIATITPFYKFQYGELKAFIGLNAQIVTDSNSTMFFYPELRFNLAAIPNILYFNLNLTGGHYRNSMKLLSDENPFIISNIPMEFTNRKYQVNFGIESSISKSVNFDVQLYYDKFENAPLFVSDTNALYRNKFTVVYEDYDRVKLQVDLTYQKHERLRFLLRGNYYVYNMTEQLHPWHKPTYDLSLTANYNIQNKFIIKSAFITYGSSVAPVWEGKEIKTETLKTWFDINIGVEYRYRKRLGIFLNFNNITASRYYRWYDYPSYKFNVMGGISYIF